MSRAGGTTNRVPVLTPCKILTSVVRGRTSLAKPSGGVVIIPEVLLTVISKIKGNAETILKTFSDLSSQRSATYW